MRASSKPCEPVTPTTASCSGFLISRATADQRFNFFLEGLAGFFVRRNDKNGVIARDGAGGFRKCGGVDGGGERLRAAGRRFQDEQILRGANVLKELAESASKRGQAVGFFRESG